MDLGSLLNLKVTTASKFSENLSDAPGVMSVVTKDELRRFGGLTLGEILDRVAGLTESTASFTDRSLVAARGDQTRIDGGHILFLINGRPTREVLEGGLIGDLLESFPVNILERIEVIKGPGSVLYGSDAFSAVINLITQKADGNGVILTGMGADGGTATSGQVMVQQGDFSLVGAAQYHQVPNWVTPCDSVYTGMQTISIPDRGQGAYLGMDYRGLSFMSAFTDYATSYIEGEVGRARWRRGFADLGYHVKASDRWDMSFNATFTQTGMSAENSIPFITRESREMVFEWTNVVTLSARDKLTFGALYNHIQGVETFYPAHPGTVIADGSRPGGAFYAQLDHQLFDNWKVIGGFQANKMGDIRLSVVPRGGVIWNPVSGLSFKALYSQAFRAPSISETSMDYIPPPSIGGPSLLGNPNLVPEKVATIDLAVGYQSGRVQVQADYFHSKQTNTIVEDAVSGLYLNQGETRFHGVEGEAKYYFSKKFFLMGSTLYQANEDGNGTQNVTPIPNFGAKGGFSYEAPNGLTASLWNEYEGHVNGYSQALNPKPGAYDLVNFDFRYDLSKHWRNAPSGVALVAHALNLGNKQVWLPDWTDVPGDSIFANRGRTIYAGVEVRLKRE
ncbi:MAG: TonB-dependent receptor [Bryobacteraceae bacterium]